MDFAVSQQARTVKKSNSSSLFERPRASLKMSTVKYEKKTISERISIISVLTYLSLWKKIRKLQNINVLHMKEKKKVKQKKTHQGAIITLSDLIYMY